METPRSLHLIDIENLNGGSRIPMDAVQIIWRAYSGHAVTVAPGDHVIVGTGPTAAPTTWFGMPAGVQRVIGRGLDGAELAILGAVDLEHAARRYDRIVVASGDHLFAPLLRDARRLGMQVHAVFGRGRPARELLAACPNRTWLGEDGRSRLSDHRRAERMRCLPRRTVALAV